MIGIDAFSTLIKWVFEGVTGAAEQEFIIDFAKIFPELVFAKDVVDEDDRCRASR